MCALTLFVCWLGVSASIPQQPLLDSTLIEWESRIVAGDWSSLCDQTSTTEEEIGQFVSQLACEVVGREGASSFLIERTPDELAGRIILNWAGKLAKKNKGNYNALFVKGAALANAGRFEDAVECLSDVLKMNSDFAPAFSERSVLRFAMAQYSDALDDINWAIKLSPDHATYYSNRGTLLSMLDRGVEAMADLDRAISMVPNSGRLYYNRANIRRKLGHHEDALIDYNWAVQFDTTLALAFLNRATTLLDLGDTARAAVDLSKFIVIAPLSQVQFRWQARHTLYTIRHRPSVPADTSQFVKNQLKQGKGALNRGDTAAARECIQTALNQFPVCWFCVCELAQLYVKSENQEVGIEVCNRYLQFDSLRTEVYAMRGLLRLNSVRGDQTLSATLGKLTQAEADLTRAIQLAPDAVYPHYIRAIVYDSMNDKKAAMADLRFVLGQSDDPDAQTEEAARKLLQKLELHLGR